MIKNVKVGTKLLSAFLLVALVGVIVGLFGIMTVRKIVAEDKKLYEKITVPLSELSSMSTSFQRVRINLRDVVEAGDSSEKRQYRENLVALRKRIGENADRFGTTIITDEARKLFAEFKESRKIYGAYIDQILQLDAAGKSSEAMSLMHGKAKQAAFREQEILDKLIESKEDQGKQTHLYNQRLADKSIWISSILVALGSLFAVILGLVITRMITRPLQEAVAVAEQIAKGDLTVEVASGGTDETGHLLSALHHMTASLRDLISRTVGISEIIASASSQLQSSSDQIATGAEEVAAQAGTVATASEEMSATSNDIARNCTMAADAARQSEASATAGASVVQETIVGMEIIADRVRQTATTVEALGARSEQIGNIIGTIEDIADQTNLLALNAAIEAARAGDQGRGFAVVADEVRALAERTTKATREIGEMIKSIQCETKEAVRAMEEGVSEVGKGADSSRKSGRALEEIMERINEVALQVSQIATAAEQQTATTGEVTSNIHQITDVVHQTARGAEETATAAAQLAGQAQDLQDLVSRFKVA